MAASSAYGISMPYSYRSFSSCFSWVNFDFPFPWDSSNEKVYFVFQEQASTDKIGRTNKRSSIEDYIFILDINPSIYFLTKTLYFAIILLLPFFLGFIFALIGICLRPSEYKNFQGIFFYFILFFFSNKQQTTNLI